MALELNTPYAFIRDNIDRVPVRESVYLLLDADKNVVAVAPGTFSDVWREVSLQPKDTVRWFVIETMEGTSLGLYEHAQVLKTHYHLLPELPKRRIGFGQ